MVNLKRLTDQARKVIDKRGGTDSLKEDAGELRDIAKGKGSLKDKAKAAGEAIKDPGAKGPDQPGERKPPGAPRLPMPQARVLQALLPVAGKRPTLSRTELAERMNVSPISGTISFLAPRLRRSPSMVYRAFS